MRQYLYPILLCFALFAVDCKAAEIVEQKSAANPSGAEYAAQQYDLGNQLLSGGAYTKGDEASAIIHFKEAAKYGHSDAMFALGRMYMTGKGVTKDTEQGMAWLEKASGSDGFQNAAAAEMLAEHYGLNSLPDTERCIKGKYWYERAARGSETAAGRLALAYANGQCVERDFAKAAELFLPLAKKGDLLAQIFLADYYFKGSGVTQDNGEAFFWARCATRFGGKPSFSFVDVIDPILELKFDLAELEKINERLIKSRCIRPIDALIIPERLINPIDKLKALAAAGNAIAQDALGTAYLHDNQDIRKNYTEAVAWYRKAAEQGYELGQYHLGRMYFDGTGVPQDDKEAAKYIQAAADHGENTAAYDLSNMYALGRGVPKNEIQSYVWCKISDQCDSNVRKRTLSPEQIIEAENLYSAQIERQKNLPRKNFFATSNPTIKLPNEK